MPLVSRKSILAIAAVSDVAIHTRGRCRPRRLPRAIDLHPPLKPALQALFRDGILKGVRGRHGGYALEKRRITAEDIMRAAAEPKTMAHLALPGSALITVVVWPALIEAERKFSAAFGQTSVEDLAKRAQSLIRRRINILTLCVDSRSRSGLFRQESSWG